MRKVFGMRINTHLLKEMRRVRGWSLTALAAVSGIPQPNLSRIEKGEEQLSWAKLNDLAKALGFEDARALVGPDELPTAETWPFRRGGKRTKASAA